MSNTPIVGTPIVGPGPWGAVVTDMDGNPITDVRQLPPSWNAEAVEIESGFWLIDLDLPENTRYAALVIGDICVEIDTEI